MRRPRDITQKKKKPRSTPAAKIVFLLSIFVIAQVIFFNSDFFRLRTIEILGSEKVPNEEIVTAAGFPWGKNILSLNLESYRKKIEAILCIKSARLSRIFPGGVRIAVVERKPVISVSKEGKDEKRFSVDEDGVILGAIEKDRDKDLPNLVIPQEIKVGDRIDRSGIKTILAFRTWLSPEMSPKVATIRIVKNTQLSFMYLWKGHAVEVRIGDLDNIKQKMEILEKILLEMEGKGSTLVYVDLRYKEPVVRISENKPGEGPVEENKDNGKKEGE